MRRGAAAETALRLALTALLAALILLPLAALLWHGLIRGDGAAVLAAPVTRRALAHTLVTGLGSTLLAGLLGGGFALLAGLTDLPQRGLLGLLFTLLLVIPPQITAIAWIALTGPDSPVLRPLGLAPHPGAPTPLFGAGGIILLQGIEQAPLVFLALRAGLRAIPRELTDAARTAGAGPWRVLTTIILPLAAPALAGGLSLAFIAAIGNFGTPALLGIPGRYIVLTTLIYQRLTGFGPSALGAVVALSLILGVLAIGCVVLERWIAGRRDVRAGIIPADPFPLGRWRAAAVAGSWLLLALLLFLPLAALVGAALVRAEGLPLTAATATFAHFRAVLAPGSAMRRALADSLLLSAVAAMLLGGIAAPACHLARRGRVLRALVAAADVPFALPGVVLAIACILLFLRPVAGIALYDTLGIILVAYLMRFLPLARRPVSAALDRLDPALEEAAQAAGAAFPRRFVTIILPLLIPAMAAGALMVFLTAFNELTVSALLWSEGHETLGVVVFNLEQAGAFTQAAAVSVIAAGVTVALMAGASLAARGTPGLLPWQS